MNEKNYNLTAHKRLYQCQSKIFSTFLSKITKYNRVPLGFDPSVARLLGHDPTPRSTCPVTMNDRGDVYTCDVNITKTLVKGYDSPCTTWRHVNRMGYTCSKEQSKRHRHSTLHSTRHQYPRLNTHWHPYRIH